MQFTYDPVEQSVDRSVGLSYFPKRQGSYTSMLLSVHLYINLPLVE